jgi:hypothetical protein
MKSDYHEKETILLKGSQLHDRKLLHKWLRKRGYRSEDDFYYLQRKGRFRPWQTSTLITLNVRRGGHEIYETEEDLIEGIGTNWDELRSEYLMATLPRECIAAVTAEIAAIAAEFDLTIEYCGAVVDIAELASRLNAVADQLTSEFDEPGSEALAILIERQYGSR